MTGDMFDAKTALALGLVNQVVAPEELMPAARKLAERIASKSAVALRQAKAALRASFTMEEDAGLRFEQETFGLTFASEDRVEGTRGLRAEARPQVAAQIAAQIASNEGTQNRLEVRSASFYRRARSIKIRKGVEPSDW